MSGEEGDETETPAPNKEVESSENTGETGSSDSTELIVLSEDTDKTDELPVPKEDSSESQLYNYHFVTEDTIEIIRYWGEETTVRIPSKLDGYTVVGIGGFGGKNAKTVYVPDTVKYVNALGGPKLQKVVLPEGLESIGDGAFYKGEGLEEVNLPSTLKYIGKNAFRYCWNLTGFTIPDGVEIGTGAFYDTKLVNDKAYGIYFKRNGEDPFIIIGDELVLYVGTDSVVTVPEGVRSIGQAAFGYQQDIQENVTTVTLPDSVEVIADRAFFNMKGLTTVNLGKGLKEIGTEAFSGDGYFTIGYDVGCESLNNVVLPEGLEKVGWGAFRSCISLTNITFPSTLEKMYTNSIEGTPYFDNLPNGENYLGGMFLYKYVAAEGEGIFYEGPAIQINVRPGTLGLMRPYIKDKQFERNFTYTLPDGLRYIGPSALEYSSDNLTLPDSVTYIDDLDANGDIGLPCSVLRDLPDSLTYIGNFVFEKLEPIDISDLEIPNGVTHIGQWAFGRISTGKMNIRLPDSLESLGQAAFLDNNIGEITNWPASITTWDRFMGYTSEDSLTLPDTILNVRELEIGPIEKPKFVLNLNRAKVVDTGLVSVYFDFAYDHEREEYASIVEGASATILMPNVERIVKSNVKTNTPDNLGVLALPEQRPVVIGKGNFEEDTYKYLTIVTYNDSMLDDLFGFKKGDVDGDGKVSVQDLRLVLRHVCGKMKLEGNALKAADLVGNDGKADIQDLRYLLRVICGKVTLE